jgi:hypothetical protein
MDDSTRHCEHSVEADVSRTFAWSYWTDVGNWVDPPARFSLDGAFVTGARGMTHLPGQELPWVIGNVEPGTSATILMTLDRATISFEWRFEALSQGRTRLTQRIELVGENANAYTQGLSALCANLPDAMKKMAAAMAAAAPRPAL